MFNRGYAATGEVGSRASADVLSAGLRFIFLFTGGLELFLGSVGLFINKWIFHNFMNSEWGYRHDAGDWIGWGIAVFFFVATWAISLRLLISKRFAPIMLFVVFFLSVLLYQYAMKTPYFNEDDGAVLFFLCVCAFLVLYCSYDFLVVRSDWCVISGFFDRIYWLCRLKRGFYVLGLFYRLCIAVLFLSVFYVAPLAHVLRSKLDIYFCGFYIFKFLSYPYRIYDDGLDYLRYFLT